MKTVSIEITGVSPLLMHKMPEDALLSLLGAKTKKVKEKDELRTPREIAEDYAYKAKDGVFCIPSFYITGAIQHVASDYKQKGSTRKSLRTIVRGAIKPQAEFFPLYDEKNKPIKNFEVDVRKATNYQKGAVAVCRPRFDSWKSKITLDIDEDLISVDTLHNLLNDAGKRSGIGSFRVSNSGSFGQFRVTSFEN